MCVEWGEERQGGSKHPFPHIFYSPFSPFSSFMMQWCQISFTFSRSPPLWESPNFWTSPLPHAVEVALPLPLPSTPPPSLSPEETFRVNNDCSFDCHELSLACSEGNAANLIGVEERITFLHIGLLLCDHLMTARSRAIVTCFSVPQLYRVYLAPCHCKRISDCLIYVPLVLQPAKISERALKQE